MALLIAITYSLTDDAANVEPAINTVTEGRTTRTTANDIVNPVRILNETEIFTMLLGTNWPLTGNNTFGPLLLRGTLNFNENFYQ